MGIKINIGCGYRFHKDWLNLDLHAHSPGVVACDLTKGVPVKSGDGDAVYAAAVLEHIRPQNVPSFLAECNRVLMKGGVIRLAVPDFEQQVRVYLDTLARMDQGDCSAMSDRDWMILEMLDQSIREKSGGEMLRFLLRENIPNTEFILQRIGVEGSDLLDQISKNRKSWQESPLDIPNKTQVPFGKIGRMLVKWLLKSDNLEKDLQALEIGRFRLLSGEVHQWAYDRYSLEQVFENAGFSQIARCEHGKSRIPNWESYHLEVSDSGIIEKPDLLVMEAVK
jgi:predicted SAM-dependent methyltransferase